MVAMEGLRTLRGFVIAGIIAVSEFGLFGILAVILGTVFALRSVGIGDKFIQQTESDQETAFQKALTLELAIGAFFTLVFLGLAPLLAFAFDQPELLPLTLALAVVPLAAGLQAPQWIYYRRMDFVRQRLLQAVDPVVSFAVAVTLAIAGFGVWSIALGMIAGVWAASLVALVASPYRIRLRFDRETARSYFSFSWPLFAGALAALVIAQSTTIVGYATLGLSGVGAIFLAGSIIQWAGRADQIVAQTMYPALCAIQERRDVLAEAFVKSNRLVLIWSLPLGAALALFGGELLTAALGEKWREAGVLMQTFGAAAALSQVAFNWTAFYRAAGETRPMAVYGVIGTVAHIAIALPLLVAFGLEGLGAGMLAVAAVGVLVRLVYVKRMFPELGLVAMIARSALAALVASAAALALRHIPESDVVVQALAFTLVFAALTWARERALLREGVGYIAGRVSAAA